MSDLNLLFYMPETVCPAIDHMRNDEKPIQNARILQKCILEYRRKVSENRLKVKLSLYMHNIFLPALIIYSKKSTAYILGMVREVNVVCLTIPAPCGSH